MSSRSAVVILYVCCRAAWCAPPAAPAMPVCEKVSFTTDDNLLITAGYVPPIVRPNGRAPVAILLHMYRSDRTAFDPLLPALRSAGFAVLAIDLRGHGESVGSPEMRLAERVENKDRKFFATMDRDLDAAYAWLAERPECDLSRFVIIGASVGASIALKYAARDKSVDGVICLTPGVNYLGIDSLADAQKLGARPVMLLASEPEKAAAEQLGRLAPEATVQIFPCPHPDRMALHGTRMFGKLAGIDKVIAEFARRAAGEQSEDPVVASTRGQVYYAPESSYGNKLSKRNVRWFSSPAEAESRGLRAPKNRGRSRARAGGSTVVLDDEAFPDDPR
jgi:pimeloyl-ACP methyl ester carboxylesterase